ncbi:MAG: 2-dehydro-3-deoxy-D-gluconate 5-dehydrogenase KduD [Pirellulales bacterium]|nr:2-dehydro-3-deoxy-D-gluconate 5-dehydrogenase KduD [Pirellulales bacterium]
MSKILDQFKLEGKAAIVTGAARGLGQGMAIALAEAGADVAAVDVIDVAETCAQISKLGRKAAAIQLDLGAAGSPQKVVDQTVSALGRLDILVNNAGIIRRADFLEFPEKDWDDVMNLNIKAVFLLSQAAARQMAEQGSGGKIISVASMLSFQGGIRVPSYTSSKSAVMGLTRLMACELGPKGIHCNAIAPGYMATDNTAPLRADEKRSADILARIPAGRWGTPQDLQGAVVFLASKASDYVNGYTLAVDGGWLAR